MVAKRSFKVTALPSVCAADAEYFVKGPLDAAPILYVTDMNGAPYSVVPPPNGVTPGTYGDLSTGPIITVDASGRVTASSTRVTGSVYIENLPGIAFGSAVTMAQAQNNVALINAALVQYGSLRGKPSSLISCAGQIALTDGCSIIGDGVGPIFRMRADSFTNVSPTNFTNATGTLFKLDGGTAAVGTINNVTIRKIRIVSAVSGGRYVCGIFARNTANLRIEYVEITGIPNGKGIVASSLRGDWSISRNYIHDFYDNSATSISGAWASLQQSTGIEIDDQRVDSTSAFSTAGGRVCNNHIENIMKGDIQSALASNGGASSPGITNKQTTGIAIASPQSNSIDISDNTIINVAQGFDIWGFGCIGSNNRFINSYLAAICLKHDARGNVFKATSFVNSGFCHVLISAGDTLGVIGNLFDGFFASGCGYKNSLASNGVPDGASNTWVPTGNHISTVYVFSAFSGQAYPSSNQFLNGTIDSTIPGQYGIYFDSSSANPLTANSNNLAENIQFINGVPTNARIAIIASGSFTAGKVRLAGSTTYTTSTLI